MKEIQPGVFHWTARHPKIGFDVSSYYIAESGTVLDPMVPPDVGLRWFQSENGAQTIALTNRHHDRDAAVYCDTLGLSPVLVPETSVIRITSYGPDESVFLTIDGQIGGPLQEGDVVVCHSSHYSLMLIRPPRMMFFDVLRQKLKWGER